MTRKHECNEKKKLTVEGHGRGLRVYEESASIERVCDSVVDEWLRSDCDGAEVNVGGDGRFVDETDVLRAADTGGVGQLAAVSMDEQAIGEDGATQH